MPVEPEWIPATPQQEGIWFHAIKHNTAFWNLVHVKPYKGVLNLIAFKQALSIVIKRHTSLRTHFRINNEKLYQVINAAPDIDTILEYISTDGVAADHQAIINAEIDRMANQEFNLEKGPLFRFKVLQFTDVVLLVTTLNHIITDGMSNQIFWKELVRYYNQFRSDTILNTGLAERQYYHFAIEQDDFFRTQEYVIQKKFWLEKLSGELPMLNIRLYHEKASTAIYYEELDIPESLVHDIKSFALKNRVVYSAVFLMAYTTLLHKYANQDTILIANIVNGRQKRINYEAIGLFADRQIMLTSIDENESFISLLQKVNHNLLTAFEQGVPYDELRRDFNSINKSGLTSLFQATFNMMKVIDSNTDFNGMERETGHRFEYMMSPDRQEDITVYVLDKINTVRIRLEWRSDERMRPVGRFMLDNFRELLVSIIQYKEMPIKDLVLLSSEEQILLKTFNDNKATFPAGETIVSLFDQQVRRTPDNTALVFGKETLTYQMLREKSIQLSHYLRRQGVTPGDRIGICMGTGFDMLTGMLGIMRAGAAYVPIDPEYPLERMKYVMEDAQLKVFLTNESAWKKTSQHPQQTMIIRMDADREKINQESVIPVPVADHSTLPAYVIYTSGSTGKPKGVLVRHSAIVNTLCWARSYYQLTPEDTALQFFSFAFDSSITEIYSHLISGARLLLLNKHDKKDVRLLASMLQSEKVTRLLTIPSLYNMLLDEMRELQLQIRAVTISGESTGRDIVNKHYAYYPEVVLINEYGPTECAVCATRKQLVAGQQVTIGQGISNMHIHILNRYHLPLPIGVAGELCISGIGVSDGYLYKDDLTKEKFIPHPQIPGERLYKTGDLARWLPDGDIEYLGRIDEQVKVRGFRIELAEIEKTVLDSGHVLQAVLLAQKDDNGSNRLIAYLVPGPDFNKTALMAFLRNTLPDYMIPARLVMLKQFPLSPNGKIDKKALLAMEINTSLADNHVNPHTVIQQELSHLWQRILGVPRIGITDNFFELGGHSLLAVRLLSAIRKELKAEISIADLLNYPTIQQQELILRKITTPATTTCQHLILLAEDHAAANLFLAPGFRGISDNYTLLAKVFNEKYTVYGFQMYGLFPGEYPLQTIEAIAAQHIAYMKEVQPLGPYRLAGHSFGGQVVYEMARQLEKSGEQVHYLLLLDAVAPPHPLSVSINNVINDIFGFLDDAHNNQPAWILNLRRELASLQTPDILSWLQQYEESITDDKKEQAGIIISALRLGLTNISIKYEIQGQITTPAILVKAQSGVQRRNKERSLGWDKYLTHLRTITSPGTHMTLTTTSQHVKALYQHLCKIELFQEK